MSFGSSLTTTTTTTTTTTPDYNVPQAGNDGVSSLTWSPTSNILTSTNWDGGVRCWEVQEQNTQIHAIPKAQGNYYALSSCHDYFFFVSLFGLYDHILMHEFRIFYFLSF